MGIHGKAYFAQIGIGLYVLRPGEPMAIYHWETDQKTSSCSPARLCSSARARSGRCGSGTSFTAPPGRSTCSSGAGDAPCAVFAVGAPQNHTFRTPEGTLEGRADWGAYTVDDAALRHGAGVEHETTNAEEAYARFPDPEPTQYRDGWLPGRSLD